MMLLGLSIENWLSFKDKTEFSMIATREQQHGERLFDLRRYKNRVLPIAAIYGANASGKTNFIKIMSTARNFILNGSRPEEVLPVYPYLLDDDCVKKPSQFSVGILIDNTIYEYAFIIDQKRVIEEKLSEVQPKKEKILFHRKLTEILFNDKIKDQEFLRFVSKGTRKNQLFLTNSVFRNAKHFKKIFDWFDNIKIITPDATFQLFEKFFDETSSLYNDINNYFKSCDIGIDGIECEEIPFSSLPLDSRSQLANIPEGKTFLVQIGHERILVTKKNGNIVSKRMISIHSNNRGQNVKFNLTDESNGILRAIDLFPAFSELCTDTPKIYIVDEIDRSLHPLLVKHLIEIYLNSCSNSKKGQLIFTTHDTNLINQKIFRRDEMWVIDRVKSSKFISFSDFENIRNDKDIRKSYMNGRFGGIPTLIED